MRIRITCKAPQPIARTKRGVPVFNMINGCVASWSDVRVTAIADDGAEMDLTNVVRVAFESEAGYEPATVRLTLVDPEIDVEGELA